MTLAAATAADMQSLLGILGEVFTNYISLSHRKSLLSNLQ